MKPLYLSLFLLTTVGFSACTSPDKPANVKNGNTSAANTVAPIVYESDNRGNVNSTIVIPLDSNTNGGPAEVKVIKPGTDITAKGGRTLPDGSIVTVELKDVPIETRVFKNHPQLVKVVKSGNPRQMTIKIYLKNGKVVDLPGDKIPNLSAENADMILGLAGVAPPVSTRKTEEKPPR